MDEGSGGLTDAYAELQRVRAFDVKAHERLMAVVATLGEASVLPAHDHRKLFSASTLQVFSFEAWPFIAAE